MNEEQQEEFERKWRKQAKRIGANNGFQTEKEHLQIEQDLKDTNNIRKSKKYSDIVHEPKKKHKVSKKMDVSSEEDISSRSRSSEKKEKRSKKDLYSKTSTDSSHISNYYMPQIHQNMYPDFQHHAAPIHHPQDYPIYPGAIHYDPRYQSPIHHLHHDPSFTHLPSKNAYSPDHFSPHHSPSPYNHYSPYHNQSPSHQYSPDYPAFSGYIPIPHPGSPNHPQGGSPYHPHTQAYSPTHGHPGRAPPASRQPQVFANPVDTSPMGASYPPPPESTNGGDTPSIRQSRY
jgi:hypothetical protein